MRTLIRWGIAILIAATVGFTVFMLTANNNAEGAQIGGKTVTLFHCDRNVPGNRYALIPGANGRGLDLVAHFSSFGSPGGVVLYCTPVRPKR